MTSVTSPQQTGRGGADIPAPRDGQVVRLLVLGADADAQELRDQASAAGFELAQRYSARVSHVAYGSGVNPEDTKYHRIREAGLALLPVQACASQLGLGEGRKDLEDRKAREKGAAEQSEPEDRRERAAGPGKAERPADASSGEAAAEVEFGKVVARIEVGKEAGKKAGAGKKTDAADNVGAGESAKARENVGAGKAEVAQGIAVGNDAAGVGDAQDVRSAGTDAEDGAEDGGEADAEDGGDFGVVEVLEFPALQVEGAAGLVPGFDRFDEELGATVGDAYAPLETLGELVEIAEDGDGGDVGVEGGAERGAEAGTDDGAVDGGEVGGSGAELPLGAAVIGVDPWTGDGGPGVGVGAGEVAAEAEAELGDGEGAGRSDRVVVGQVVGGGGVAGIGDAGGAAGAGVQVGGAVGVKAGGGEEVETSDGTVTEAGAAAGSAAESADAATGAPSDAAAPTSRVSAGYVLLSLAWALIPFVTFGLLTPVVFGYAAFRLRSRMLGVVALGYTVAVVLSFALSASRPYGTSPTGTTGAVLTLALAAAWIGGTVHALSLRVKVFSR